MSLPLCLVDSSVYIHKLMEQAHRVDSQLLPLWARATLVVWFANPLQLPQQSELQLLATGDLKKDGKYWRHHLIADYKGTRGVKPPEFTIIKSELRGLLPIFEYEEWESDDLIAEAVRVRNGAGSQRHIYISSIDNDLSQLVCERTTFATQWEPRLRGPKEVLEYIEKKNKVVLRSVAHFPLLKAIIGDKGDNLAPGCGLAVVDLIEPPSTYSPEHTLDDWPQRAAFEAAVLGDTQWTTAYFCQRRSAALRWINSNKLPLIVH